MMNFQNWWIDDPDPAAAEGVYPGAKSVNQWRAASAHFAPYGANSSYALER
jgi:hypothetical protein